MPSLVKEQLSGRSEIPVVAVASGQFLGAVIIAPLAFYILAAIGNLSARIAGWKIEWLRSRIALFWSVAAISPSVFLHGVIQARLELELVSIVLQWGILLIFLGFWLIGMREAARMEQS